jgi:uncharacterized protein
MIDMKVLLEMQDLDIELERYRVERKELPAELEELEGEFDAAGGELEAREAEIKALKVEIRDAEGKVAQLDESQEKYKQQLLTVKTNREYSALLTEIESVKREKDELEELEIQKMGGVESAETAVQECRDKAAGIEEKLNERRGELKGKIKELDGQIGKREKKHSKLAENVPVGVLRLYTRIMSSKFSRAVVNVRNGSCGGCFAHIPLQKVADIRIGSSAPVYTCDHCGRILYYDDGESS